MRAPRILVAGIGNVFFGDDGFGSAVVERLSRRALPDGTRVVDFGIRGVHLAYELAGGCDGAVLVDAARRGGAPGTLYVIDPEVPASAQPIEAHELDPVRVLALVRSLGEPPRVIRLVACEPERAGEDDGMVLSDPVRAAVADAVELVLATVETMRAELAEPEAQHA